MRHETRGRGGRRGTSVWRHFYIVSAALLLLAGWAFSIHTALAEEKKPEAGKTEVRNNAASLLADLLGKEKELDKILIIKRDSGVAGDLAKEISKQAAEGQREIEQLAKSDATLNLKVLGLPPGEMAARSADGDSERHALLSSSGANFQLKLLLTQTQAMNYASHLAGVAAANAANPEQARVFHSLETALNNLYGKVVASLRVVERK